MTGDFVLSLLQLNHEPKSMNEIASVQHYLHKIKALFRGVFFQQKLEHKFDRCFVMVLLLLRHDAVHAEYPSDFIPFGFKGLSLLHA